MADPLTGFFSEGAGKVRREKGKKQRRKDEKGSEERGDEELVRLGNGCFLELRGMDAPDF